MRYIFLFYVVLSALMFSCKEDTYYVKADQDEINGYKIEEGESDAVAHDIEGNLVVNGSVVIQDEISIKNDFNLNRNGVARIAPLSDTSKIVVYGNMNTNDSVFVESGILIIKGNLNINSNSFFSVSDSAIVIVEHNLNQNSYLFGFSNVYVYGKTHLNEEQLVFPYFYEIPE